MKSKNRVILTIGEFLEVEADFGPLVPINAVAKLLNIGRQRAYRLASRGRVNVFQVWGQKFLPVTECNLALKHSPVKGNIVA